MFFDFRQFENSKQIDTDICIVGAGAAGISIAHALIGSGIQVALLESGGFDIDSAIQSLYDGQSVGIPYFSLNSTRLRYFGGSTNHWGGWCAPLNEIDFEARPWVSHSGWPIRKQDLDAYYEVAQQICQLGPYRYAVEAWSDEHRQFPAFHSDKVVSQLWQLIVPPLRFGKFYRSALDQAQNVRVFLYANVTEFKTTESASAVQTVRIRTLEGKTGAVRAKCFVLAGGGIENARLLLLSNKESGGLGNRYGLVGRFFMDHPHLRSASLLAREPRALVRQFTLFERGNGVRLLAGICPTPAAQTREQILNYSAVIDFQRGDYATGFDAFKKMRGAFAQRAWPEDLGEKLWTVITDLDDVFGGALRPEGEPYVGPVKSLGLYTRSEQAPNPDSRITLSEERDSLGLNKVKLDWRLTELDKRTLRVANRLVGEEFGRLGLGRLQLADWLVADDAGWPELLEGGHHHMGTTRMADDAKQGVVDRNCRVHGIGNLYIAGSSVFPTSGYANPTLTLIALAMRLADHLKAQLRA